jgi:hypothetical protein
MSKLLVLYNFAVAEGHGRPALMLTSSACRNSYPRRSAAGGRCHEMLKSRLQSRYRARFPSTRVVQQTALLFKTLPRRRCG